MSVHMKIHIPASVTFSSYPRQNKYKWRDNNKTSIYNVIENRLVLRISTGQFGKKAFKLDKKNRKVIVNFNKDKEWILTLRRTTSSNVIMSVHAKNPKHIWLQVILNKLAPKQLFKELELKSKFGSRTIPVKVKIELGDWSDINLKPEDFLYHAELQAKSLLSYALSKKFLVDYVPKGREYDLQLISSNNKKFAIAISSYIAKNESRSKQHRVQKALTDIAKMLSTLYYDKDLIPVIISQPFQFNRSWNFVRNDYIKFYQEKFNFKFIFTNFKDGWEKEVCNELDRI